MGGPAVVTEMEMLRMVELKSRVRPDDVAVPLDLSPEAVGEQLDALVSRGLITTAGRGYRISADGKAHLAELLEKDRAGIDTAALDAAYKEFCAFNAELKQIITDWQITPSGDPNDHTDHTYDAGVLARLCDLHTGVEPLLVRFDEIAPRLHGYSRRFATARAHIDAGETTWVARPILDSFHTVWFELHEELIQLSGRTRAEEAAAGRAQ